MRAIVHGAYGAAPEDVLRLEEIAKPTIAADQVLVRVRAASVDRGTWHIMAGLPYPIRVAGFGLRKPKHLNPGRSLAGTVESVGNDVTGLKPGDEVFGICDGSFAEYAARGPTSWHSSRRMFPSRGGCRADLRGSPPSRRCATTERSRPGKRC